MTATLAPPVRPRRDPATYSPMEAFIAERRARGISTERATAEFMGATTALERANLLFAWHALWARPSQRLPDHDEWDLIFARAGRGFGKTRFGSEGVRRLVQTGKASLVTIIGPTAADARDVMIEGPESGLLAVHPPDVRPVYKPSNRTLEWPNGALGRVRSAEEPDSVRGLNSDLVWGDEPASWKTGSAAWDNAMLGNRLNRPHAILTGTPRPIEWLRALEVAAGTVVRTGSTYENMSNLATQFIDLVLGRYEGTRLGRQELNAEYLDDVEGAMWRLAVIEATRIMLPDPRDLTVRHVGWWRDDPWKCLVVSQTYEVRAALGLGAYTPAANERRPWVIRVGVDPPGETAECGIIVATAPRNARYGKDHFVVLDDLTVEGPPEVWGPAVAQAAKLWGAEYVVVESNQGGDMVRSTVHAADPNIKVRKVRAVVSKSDRAEPVSVLFSRALGHLAGYFPRLESQMTTWVAGESKSPDRLDAMVHVATDLVPPNNTGTGTIISPLG